MIHQVRDEGARVKSAQERVVGLQVQGDDPGGKLARNGNLGPERNIQRPQTVIAQHHIRLVRMYNGDRGSEGANSRVVADTVCFGNIALHANGLAIDMGSVVDEIVGQVPVRRQRCATKELKREAAIARTHLPLGGQR